MSFADRMTRAAQKGSGLRDAYLTPPTGAATKWEYAILQYSGSGGHAGRDQVQEDINLMGSYGWEMCARHDSAIGFMRSSQDYLVLFFKRPTA